MVHLTRWGYGGGHYREDRKKDENSPWNYEGLAEKGPPNCVQPSSELTMPANPIFRKIGSGDVGRMPEAPPDSKEAPDISVINSGHSQVYLTPGSGPTQHSTGFISEIQVVWGATRLNRRKMARTQRSSQSAQEGNHGTYASCHISSKPGQCILGSGSTNP